jgi:hypothetical protein
VRSRLTVLAVVAAACVLPGAAAAQVAPPPTDPEPVLPEAWQGCGYQELGPAGEPICIDGASGPESLPLVGTLARATATYQDDRGEHDTDKCPFRNEVFFWTDTNWLRVARNLAANPAPCTEYYISIPPQATPKHELRRFQAAQIRAFGPQFHALADVHLGETGWVQWVRENRHRFASDEEAWYEAGVELRRRMARPDVNFDVAGGDSWLLNDFNTGTRRDGGTYKGLDLDQWKRRNMRALIRGLYEGPADGSLGKTAGIAQVAIQFTHQNIPFIEEYKEDWKAWLQDEAFWADAKKYVRWIGKEVYSDTRLWGGPETPLAQRAHHLQHYQFHVAELAEKGPASTHLARDYLREAYLPLTNGTWGALGPDRFDPLFCCGHGETFIPIDHFLHYVTEELHAIRKYAERRPNRAPQGRLGFTWQPTNNWVPPRVDPPMPNAEFLAGQDAIVQRIAAAIVDGYGYGGTARAMCEPPGTDENWCDRGREGSTFTEQWKIFRSWDREPEGSDEDD